MSPLLKARRTVTWEIMCQLETVALAIVGLTDYNYIESVKTQKDSVEG